MKFKYFNKKHLFLLVLFGMFMAFYVSNVYAECAIDKPPVSTREYGDCLNVFGDNYWTNGTWIAMVKYILAPFLFIFFLIDGILSEINILRSDVSRAVSLIIALIALFSPINLTIAQLTANYTALSVMLFFAALVLLGLSHHYKKRLEEWGYAFGGSYFQMLLAHAPLMVFLFIGGYVVGNSPKVKEYLEAIYKLLFSSYKEIGGFIPISSTLLIIIFLTYATIDYYRYMNVGGTFRSLISKKRIINIIVLTLALSFLYKYSEKAPGLLTGTLGVLVGSYVAYINYLVKRSEESKNKAERQLNALSSAISSLPLLGFYSELLRKIVLAASADKKSSLDSRIRSIIDFIKNYKSIPSNLRNELIQRFEEVLSAGDINAKRLILDNMAVQLDENIRSLRADIEAKEMQARELSH